jgi:hypothetical protein
MEAGPLGSQWLCYRAIHIFRLNQCLDRPFDLRLDCFVKGWAGMAIRKRPTTDVETSVLVFFKRRCCLCFFLEGRENVRRGQIAHINRKRNDSRFENLVFLCFDHHDEYDGKTRQSKAFTPSEVRNHRDHLYAMLNSKESILANASDVELIAPPAEQKISNFEKIRTQLPKKMEFMSQPWRFPLWQVANQPEFFAYKVRGGADGVCLIERIKLPDRRVAIVCIQTAGDPGRSITNCVEEWCFQVCERFEIPPEQVVWLANYDYDETNEWLSIRFEKYPPTGPFEGPTWTVMTPHMWSDLRLKPKRRLRQHHHVFDSKVTKLFDWPTEAIL